MIIYIKTEGGCKTLSLNTGSKGFDVEVFNNIPGAKESTFAGVSFNLKESEEDRQRVRDLISHLQLQLGNYEESEE